MFIVVNYQVIIVYSYSNLDLKGEKSKESSDRMRLPDEQDEKGMSPRVTYTIVAVSILILIILAYVLISNSQNKFNHIYSQNTASPEPLPTATVSSEGIVEFTDGETDLETLYREHKLTSQDLEFWDMYDGEESDMEAQASPTASLNPTPAPSQEPTDEEKAADGNHILVSYKDGTQEWVEIDDKIPKSDYDFTKMKTVNGKMTYYDGNKKLSRLGVEISEENGTVDFETLRDEGIDFVMLKVGARGYGTGLISLDQNFVTNIEAASEAGLEIGVYFCSQAVTVDEAIEEAQFVAANLIPYKITYPVALRMESIKNDTARTDILDTEQKTQIVETFLKEVEREGHDAILYGDRDWLLSEILSSEILKKYDVWLTDQSPVPDYPYQFKMWEYAGGESINGVGREVNYTISFVDYSKR